MGVGGLLVGVDGGWQYMGLVGWLGVVVEVGVLLLVTRIVDVEVEKCVGRRD